MIPVAIALVVCACVIFYSCSDSITGVVETTHYPQYAGPIDTTNICDSAGIYHNKIAGMALIAVADLLDSTQAMIDDTMAAAMIDYSTNTLGWDYSTVVQGVEDGEAYFDDNYIDSTFVEFVRDDTKDHPGMTEDHDEFIDRLYNVADIFNSEQEAKDSLDQIQADIIAFDWGSDPDEAMLSMIAIARHSFDFWLFAWDSTRTLSKTNREASPWRFLKTCFRSAVADALCYAKCKKANDDHEGSLNLAGMVSSRVFFRLYGYDFGETINGVLDQYIR